MADSAQIQSTADENRSKSDLPIQFYPIQLPADLPITMHYPHVHPDHPIAQLHVHACWELGLCFEGSGIFMVGSKVMSFSPGTVSLIGPDEPHLAQSLQGTTSRWAWIYFNPLPLVNLLSGNMQQLDPTPLHGPDFENLIATTSDDPLGASMRALVDELGSDADDRATMIRALVCQILLLHGRRKPVIDSDQPQDRPTTQRQLQRIAPALEFMAENYHQHMDVPNLAKRCAMSESNFRRRFTQTMQVSPQVYWQRLRIRMAASLLTGSQHTILAISQLVGFESLSSFNRLFKQIMGQSPSQWRQHRQ